MPIGIIINALSIVIGGILGAFVGHKLSPKFKEDITLVFGVCSMGMGISTIGLMENMPAVIFSIVIGTGIGLAIHLGEKINAGAGVMQRVIGKFIKNSNSELSEDEFMNTALLDLTDRLVSISDFSQGKAGKIFNDVAENNTEYIVLKNNQPTAVVVSINEYRDIQEKISKLEKLLDRIENIRLLKLAESRVDSPTSSFEEFVKEEGFSMKELEKLSESVEFE